MLRLEFPEQKHKKQWEKMKEGWTCERAPSRVFFGGHYQELLERVQRDIDNSDRGVNAHLFFLVNEKDEVVGVIQIRHHIDHPVLGTIGGHIGYGIATAHRGKGYATQMLALALDKIKELQLPIEKVLITCDIENIASARVMEKNGGIYEGLGEYQGEKKKRYWIDLHE